MKKIILHFIFIIIVAGVLAGHLLQKQSFDYIFKPLIMIWVAGYFLSNAKQVDKKVVKLALLAFFFSWLGDDFLMFGNKDFIWFLLGLMSFLVAQLVYINLFLRTINLSGKKPFLKKQPYWLILYIAYGLVIYIILFEHLDSILKIGVLIYMMVLLSMSVMALNRFGNGHSVSFSLVFAGSVLFVLSDTMIAVDTFLTPFSYSRIFIMVTYIGAQYLIMRGLLKQYE